MAVTYPQTPGVEERVFDVEVVHIVEDSLDLVGGYRVLIVCGASWSRLCYSDVCHNCVRLLSKTWSRC